MPKSDSSRSLSRSSRRAFLKTSTVVAGGMVAGGLSLGRSAHAAGSDVLKLGLIGCGGRGTGAAGNAMTADKNTKLVAMGDAFGAIVSGLIPLLGLGDADSRSDVLCQEAASAGLRVEILLHVMPCRPPLAVRPHRPGFEGHQHDVGWEPLEMRQPDHGLGFAVRIGDLPPASGHNPQRVERGADLVLSSRAKRELDCGQRLIPLGFRSAFPARRFRD